MIGLVDMNEKSALLRRRRVDLLMISSPDSVSAGRRISSAIAELVFP
jgi:hypothetical protein